MDQARLNAALDAVAELFSSCSSPEEEVLAAEQVHLFTSLLRSGAVICPEDLPGALRAMRESAPEQPFPDPSLPDVEDFGDDDFGGDVTIGGAGRPWLYLAVDNTAAGPVDPPEPDDHLEPTEPTATSAVGSEQPPPTGTP